MYFFTYLCDKTVKTFVILAFTDKNYTAVPSEFSILILSRNTERLTLSRVTGGFFSPHQNKSKRIPCKMSYCRKAEIFEPDASGSALLSQFFM